MCKGDAQVIHTSKSRNEHKKVFNIFGNSGDVIKIIMPFLSIRLAKIDKIYTPQCWQS